MQIGSSLCMRAWVVDPKIRRQNLRAADVLDSAIEHILRTAEWTDDGLDVDFGSESALSVLRKALKDLQK